LAQTKVIVLAGGTSDEREVSLRSGESIVSALENLDESQRRARPLDLQWVEIDPEGHWILEGRAIDADAAMEQLHPAALYFIALHGGEGENGHIQRSLGARGLTFTGSGPEASALCMDKAHARTRAQAAGLSCAPGLLADPRTWGEDPDQILNRVFDLGPGPWFVKPNCGGSSLGVVRAANSVDLRDAIDATLGMGQEALVEREIVGLEVSDGILGGNSSSGLLALPLCEILPDQGRYFDYHQKYDGSGAQELCPPEHTPPEQAAEVEAMARSAFDALGCEGYARVDFILPAAGGPPVFLEANTLPGMTERSLLPRAARAVGLDMGSLCLEIMAQGLVSSRARGRP
jgi:D-alanine-D-alanine ligase